jgi:3-oxoacyl-[acyl-carrier protein] reductase
VLQDRVAIVTGAAQGIGRAIAGRLAREGASVVVNDLDRALCDAAVGEIEAAGGRAAAAQGSVSDPASADGIVAAAEAAFGRLDILVNNAGVTRDAVLHRMTDDEWRLVHDVVLWGTFCLCRASARHRKVVNVSSIAGVYGAAGTANYSAAKAGVIGLTKALAREWARFRVNVNAVAPGMISGTRITAEKPADLMAQIERSIPIGRAGTPEDVAAAVAFLASADADYVTGQVLELHGGMELIAN